MLEGIITYLNTQITASGYVEKVYDLAQQIDRDSRTFPAVYCNGDFEDTTNFDKWQGLSYWRITAPIETVEAENTLGVWSDLQYSYPLRLVIGVKRDHLGKDDSKYNADKLGWAVQKLFKDKDITLKRSIGAKKASIVFASIDNDIKRILESEVIGLERQIPNDYILIAADMNIEITASKGCIDTFCNSVAAPSLLSASSSSSGVTLTWTDNSSNETSFLVFRSNTIDGLYSQIGSVSANTTTYNDTTGTVDVSYYYKVKATDGSSNSPFSNAACGLKYSAACDPATATLNGSTLATIASGGSEAITVERGGSDITSSCSINGENNIQVPSQTILNTASHIKTGQTTSYASGDDGDREDGRLTSWLVLDFNNFFGNTNRFTDELGGQTYTNGIVIDHAYRDQINGTVLGYVQAPSVLDTGDWADELVACAAYTVGSFTSGWRMPNIRELISIYNFELVSGLDYAPFNYVSSGSTAIWSSTTRSNINTTAYILERDAAPISNRAKTSGPRRSMPVRTFTWNGSALT